MKLGWENCNKTVAALVLLNLAVGLMTRMLTTQATLRNQSLNERSADKTDRSKILDPTIRYTDLEFVENKRYQGIGRNIFRDCRKPARSRHTPSPLPIPPAPAPVTPEPQITLRFIGFVSMLDVPRKGFFGDGDALFVASEGQIVDQRYRVLRIDVNSVEVEDVIEHSKHTLALPG